MAKIKLNSNRAETKADHIKRNNTLKRAVSRDNSLLQPATDLSDFAKKLFYTIKKEQPTLSNSDNFLLNLYCSEVDMYMNMNDYISKHGVTDANGKRNAQVQLWKESINQILKLSSKLGITPADRISADYHSQDTDDPLKKAVIR